MEPTDSFVYVAESLIHGKGLFAKTVIPANTIIGTVQTQTSQEDGPYVLWSEDMTICVEVICDLKYINHSDQPNVAYFDDNTVVALENIYPHTELTHNYGTENAFIDDTFNIENYNNNEPVYT